MSHEQNQMVGGAGDEDDYDDQVRPELLDLIDAPVPTSVKTTRACKRCGLLKTVDQFLDEGCNNCEFLEMRDSQVNVNRCTTAFFEGTLAVADPQNSWAAKWIRVDGFLPGVYAITITGTVDEEMKDKMENLGLRWRCKLPSEE